MIKSSFDHNLFFIILLLTTNRYLRYLFPFTVLTRAAIKQNYISWLALQVQHTQSNSTPSSTTERYSTFTLILTNVYTYTNTPTRKHIETITSRDVCIPIHKVTEQNLEKKKTRRINEVKLNSKNCSKLKLLANLPLGQLLIYKYS